MFKKNWLIVGISGTTCSGKTSLTKKLKENFKNAVIFYQDNYFLPKTDPRHVLIPELNHNNWEILTAIDMKKLHQDILETLNRNDSGDQKNKKILIIDGFLSFNYKPLIDLYNLKYFIHLSKDVCIERRNTRQYDPPDVPGYFEKVVWPEYEKHYSEILENTNLKNSVTFIDGTLSQNEIFQKVFNEIQEKLKNN